MKKAIGAVFFLVLVSSLVEGDQVEMSTIVCPGGKVTHGVDVSSHQPNTAWNQVKIAGQNFAFIKATEGPNYINPFYNKDMSDAKVAGFFRSSYHYFIPGNDPIVQADFFLSTIANPKENELAPMLDWERDDDRVSAEENVSRAKAWLDRVEAATGKIPVIYTNARYIISQGNPQGFDRYPLFINDFNGSCPEVPGPWTNWTIWQQGIGKLNGIQSEVDLDIFNGEIIDLPFVGNPSTDLSETINPLKI